MSNIFTFFFMKAHYPLSDNWLHGDSSLLLKCGRCPYNVSVGCGTEILHTCDDTGRFPFITGTDFIFF